MDHREWLNLIFRWIHVIAVHELVVVAVVGFGGHVVALNIVVASENGGEAQQHEGAEGQRQEDEELERKRGGVAGRCRQDGLGCHKYFDGSAR